eukprot:GEMP01060194.1.p1 GENE.GEMP01060194.1~~GEMP01060194.1.p1  ORF type:complete len:320 (+),score=94.85 GEMP01060194.1:31-960(+)
MAPRTEASAEERMEEEKRAMVHLEKKLDVKKDEIKRMREFAKDYDTLHSTLETLPNKLRHDVMVPFSSMAFFEGEIHHTNEVLMLLGEDWFAERTTQKALETVDSRKALVEENIALLEKEILTLQKTIDIAGTEHPSSALTIGSDGLMEIKEQYNKEAESAEQRSRPSRPSPAVPLISKADLAALEALEVEEERLLAEKDSRSPLEERIADDNNLPVAPQQVASSPSDLFRMMEDRENKQLSENAPPPSKTYDVTSIVEQNPVAPVQNTREPPKKKVSFAMDTMEEPPVEPKISKFKAERLRQKEGKLK